MTPENFVYWLQGFLELQDPQSINEGQLQVIKEHIALVLEKKTSVNGTLNHRINNNVPSYSAIPAINC